MDTPALRNLSHGDPMLSSLLAFASGLAAKVVLPIKRDPIDVEIIVRLQTELNDLRRQFDETLTRVERQRDDWQALAMEYRDALFRRPAPQQHSLSMRKRAFVCRRRRRAAGAASLPDDAASERASEAHAESGALPATQIQGDLSQQLGRICPQLHARAARIAYA